MIVLWSRYAAIFYIAIIALGSLPMLTNGPLFKLIFIISLSLFFLGLYDFSQKKRPVLANFPIIGRFRFIFESIRPELRQYFWESDKDELPYSRNQRSMVYQRSKSLLAARPFGSDEDQYADDFTWLNHSITPTNISDDDFRVNVGEGDESYARVQSSVGLHTILVKVLYRNIISWVGEIQSGKYLRAISVAGLQMANLIR